MNKLTVALCLLTIPLFGAEYWPALTVNPTNGVLITSNTNITFEGSFTAEFPTLNSTTLGAEGIRKIGSLGGYTLEEYFEDTAHRGLARDYARFETSITNSLLISWSDGDVYEPTMGYFHLNSGSKLLVDNAVNYAYWSTNDTVLVQWTTGTRPPAAGNIYIATFTTAFGSIINQGTGIAVGDELLSEDVAFSQIMPSIIVEGLNVYPTGIALTNIIHNGGTEYHNMADSIVHTPVNFNTLQLLTYYTHTNSLWAKITTNRFPIGIWDNGTDITSCTASKWYRGLFVSISGSGSLQYVLPDMEFASEEEALAGNDPDTPSSFVPYIPICTAYVFKGDDAGLRNDLTYWLDRRFMIRRGTLSSGGTANTPTLAQVLQAGNGTGGILPSGMGYPVSDDQASSKGYVDSVRNKASTGTAYVDPVNGDDVTGRIEKSSLPFKTIQAAVDACAVVATADKRFLVSISVGSYDETVTMHEFVSVRGSDISSTIVNGQVIFPSSITDITGCELALISVNATNKPAIYVDLGGDEAYAALRSCAVYSLWSIDVPVKSTIKGTRGNFEVYGTTWVEGNTTTADGSVGVSCLYYGTTNSSNMGKLHLTDYSGSHTMRVVDTNDTISVGYSDAATDSFMEMISCQTRIHLSDSPNHINKIKLGYMNGGNGSVDLKGCIPTINFHLTNDCTVILAASENSPSYRSGSGVHYTTGRVRAPNLKVDRAFTGSATTTNDYVESFWASLAPQTSVYPQRYTADGSDGTVGYVLAHGNGDLLLGGGIDIGTDTTETVLPAVGHMRLYVNPYAGLEQPYFKDSSGNTIRIAMDSIFNGYNDSGTTMAVGTPVYIKLGRSPQATHIIGRCQASIPSTMPCYGVVVQNGGITNGGVGRVMVAGRTESYLNTSYATNGAPLYVGEGAVTNVVPSAGIKQQIGYVHTSAVNGWMTVHLMGADFLSPSMIAWTSANTNTVNALTVRGYTAEQLTSQAITYYVWGSLAGPYTNPVSRLAKIASSVGASVRTNTYVNCTNGMFLGGISLNTNESPRTLSAGVVSIHNNLSTTSTNDSVVKGTLYVYESDQTTLVQSFDGELVHILDNSIVHPYDLAISVTNDVTIKDLNRILLFRTRLVSGWAGETINALSQDGYLTRVVISGSITGVYASSTELNEEIADRIAGDTNLQSQVTIETNRAFQAEAAIVSNQNSINTNVQAQVNSATNRVKALEDRTNVWNTASTTSIDATNHIAGIESRTNVWNTASTTSIDATNHIAGIESRTNVWNTAALPSVKFLANVGATANQTFAQATAIVLFTNLVHNYGGTYSNSTTVARWIPGFSNVMVRIMGSMSVNGDNQPILFSIKLYKNGSLKSTMATRYSLSNNDDWAMSFQYIDITSTATDYYEIFATSTKAAQVMLGSGADNWWSGEVVQ